MTSAAARLRAARTAQRWRCANCQVQHGALVNRTGREALITLIAVQVGDKTVALCPSCAMAVIEEHGAQPHNG